MAKLYFIKLLNNMFDVLVQRLKLFLITFILQVIQYFSNNTIEIIKYY